jgi:hypothetical protein
VWAGIIGDVLVGPHVLPQRLTGNSYVHFLENDLPTLLEDLPLAIRAHMWFMHDGASPYFSITDREFLDMHPARWIGSGGPTAWPPRSPDFHLWGHLKTLVYATPVNDIKTLRQRVEGGCQTIRNTPGIFGTCSAVHDNTCSVLRRSTRRTFGTLTIKCREGKKCSDSERRIFRTHVV